MRINGLPPKPAGEAKMKYHFTIDIYGNLRMEKYSLDNGVKHILNKNISYLLVPDAFSEELVTRKDHIRANIINLRGFSSNIDQRTIEKFKTTIIKQLNSIPSLCASLDEANILLSGGDKNKEFSLWNIQKLYVAKNQKFIEINKILLEVCDLLDKKFPEEGKEQIQNIDS